MKEYQIKTKIKAIKARNLLLDYLNPKKRIDKLFQQAVIDGRLRFFSKHIEFSGAIVDKDDYLIITPEGDVTPVSAEYLNKIIVSDE